MRLRTVAVAIATVITAFQSTGRADSPVFRIDAVVLDARGRSVENLKNDDFQLLEDGAARTIQNVQYVKSTGSAQSSDAVVAVSSRADEQAEAKRENARLFAIFVDEYHITAGEEVLRARQWLTKFVEERLGPRDLLMLVKPLDSLVDFRLTHDRQAVETALERVDGRKGDYTPRNPFERNYIAADPARIEIVRSQIVTSALNALAVHLGSLTTGRKTIIFVSDGFKRAPRVRGDEPLPTVDNVIRSANRGGVSIYAVKPRALVSGGPSATQPTDDNGRSAEATLRALSEQTVGAAMLAAADVEPTTGRIIGDASGYYLIAFEPAHGDDVGAFHPVQLRVRRTGVVVHARGGYWTASVDEILRAKMAAKAAEPKPPPEPPLHASPLIRPWFGIARAADGKVRVSFVWEPAGHVPGDRRARSPARVMLKAIKNGATVFEGDIRPTQPIGSGDAATVPAEAAFDVSPGRLRVQMTIEDEASRLLDTDVRDVLVESLDGRVALGSPQVLRARNAREFRHLAADPDASPVATREFSRTERLLVRVPAYGDGGQPVLTVRLLARNGAAMRELPVEAGAGGVFQVDVPLAGLAPAEYSLEITAVSGGADCKEIIRFRVTG